MSARPVTARRGILVLAMAGLLLASGCSTQAPAALVRKTVPAPETSDPVHPCTREAAAATAAPVAGGAATVRFDAPSNTIQFTQGVNVGLTALSKAVGNPAALREVTPGEWLLSANLEIEKGASLTIAAPEVRWLKLKSDAAGIASLTAVSGGLAITGSCVTSWDDVAQRADVNSTASRSFVLARDGASLTIDQAEIGYLGYGNKESYGLSWRTDGTTGHLAGSIVAHNYYGVYTYGVGGLAITGNDIHDNVLYGVDPHTGSHDLKIENNEVHDNGKHGIILAQNCVNSIISGNTVYRNAHHGIVLFLHSDNNTVENNDTFLNASQGVNINESANDTVVDNRIYDNLESGVGIAQTGQDNTLRQNDIRGNKIDGVRLVTAATATSLQENMIGQNGRYGVYVDSDGPFTLADNTIWANKAGLQMKGAASPTQSGNSIFDNTDADVRTS